MKALKWIVGTIVGLFVAMLILGALVRPDPAREKLSRIEEACDQMMSDAALGNERRMTRRMCDDMKAQAKIEAGAR